MLGIGIDTGGTCTDAVIFDFETKEILGSGKTQTTKNRLETGIAKALDSLPQDLVQKAEMIGLSTTLATNACLENRGARVKLLMIGFDVSLLDHLKDIYASYGLKDLSRLILIDAKAEGVYAEPFDPDWEKLRHDAPALFEDCDSIGIVQKHPKANGGRFELTALKILNEELSLPITLSYDISKEVDILKTCAGTLLNARLIPLVSEFMVAVQNVMKERGLDLPISIVRSDGSTMSEEMAEKFPVETILCGPSASVVGGSALAQEESGIIVDMGGTTTDIAIIRDQSPVLAKDGISIGQWKTMVQGLFVDTVGLGGDSAVRYKNNHLFLDKVRVIPLSLLASEYDNVLPTLKELSERHLMNSCWIYEFYTLQKEIGDKVGYTDYEKKICEMLREKPLNVMELAEKVGCHPRFLSTERLEEDGVLMKSGLTPTDMMILKGDFSLYDGAVLKYAMDILSMNIAEPLDEVPDRVYEMVYRRMYENIGRVILQQQYPRRKEFMSDEYLVPFLSTCYEEACLALDHDGEQEDRLLSVRLATPYPLIGVGAPIHIFLPRVAQLLHTRAVIPEYAGVANALGAVASRKVTRCEQLVKAEYRGTELLGYVVSQEGTRRYFDELEDAVSYGRAVLEKAVREKASLQGIKGEPHIVITEEENRFGHQKDGLLFEVLLSASATEQ